MPEPLNPSPPDWEKLGRYLAGESSPDEAAAISRWLEAHKADAVVLAALDSAAKRAAAPGIDVEAALLKVKARAKAGARRTIVRVSAFAAVAAALATAAVLIPWSSLFVDIGVPGRLTAAIAYGTQVGQRDSVRLPDSSLVVLGPDSRVRYSSEAGLRFVDLDGQAFFRVVHDPRNPFIVRAGSASIRDVGTEFSIHNDPAEPVRVVVHEGVVEVMSVDSVTLRRGDVAIVGLGGAIETRRGAATADDLAWTRGRLVFRNAPLAEVAADLRRWYGVELQVTDSALLRRHFTGAFAGDPVNRVLDVIALALPARVERRGDTVYVRPTAPTK